MASEVGPKAEAVGMPGGPGKHCRLHPGDQELQSRRRKTFFCVTNVTKAKSSFKCKKKKTCHSGSTWTAANFLSYLHYTQDFQFVE